MNELQDRVGALPPEQRNTIIGTFLSDFISEEEINHGLNLTYNRKVHGYIEVDGWFLRAPYIMRYMTSESDFNEETIKASIKGNLVHRRPHDPDKERTINRLTNTISHYKSGIALLVTELKCLELFHAEKGGNYKNVDIIQEYKNYSWTTKAQWGKTVRYEVSATARNRGADFSHKQRINPSQ